MAIFQPRTEQVRMYGGDYAVRIEEHDARLDELAKRIIAASPESKGPVRRMGQTSETVQLAADYEAEREARTATIEEAKQHSPVVTVQQLPRSVGKALRKAHPPRKAGVNGATDRDERNDYVMGVNEETFKEAIVRGGEVSLNGQMVTYRTVVDPELDDDDWEALSEGQFLHLYQVALKLNYGFVSDPKETPPASQLMQGNATT